MMRFLRWCWEVVTGPVPTEAEYWAETWRKQWLAARKWKLRQRGMV